MKKRRKPLAFLTALCLSLSLFAFSIPASAAGAAPGNTSAEAPSASLSGSVYAGTLSYSNATDANYTGADYSGTYFAYIPDCEGYGTRPTISPVLIVYGDEAYTEESVMQTAMDSGLAAIADAERAPVIFVNPSSVDGWADVDAASLVAIVKTMFSDSTNNSYTAGEGKSSGGLYPGYASRIYVFAEGAGADFAYEYLAPGVTGVGQYFGTASWKPTALFLMNPASDTAVDLSVKTSRKVPVYIVNGSESVAGAFTALNGDAAMTVTNTSATADGFDGALLQAAYDSLLEHWFTRDLGGTVSLLTIDDYSVTGLVKTRHDTSAGGTNWTYYSYVPTSAASAPAGTVPLFVIFHGGGNHAENIVFSSGIDKLAAADGFMVISLQNHTAQTTAQTMEIIQGFVAANPQTDTGRIYLGGFSMGSIKTMNMISDYSSYFAGAMPMNAFSTSPALQAENAVMPVFYSAGANSHLASGEFPSASNSGNATLDYFYTVNSVDDAFIFDSAYTWGKQPSLEVVTTATDIVDPPLALTTHYFQSKDGNTYTAFASAASAGHEPTLVATTEGWNFIKQFSRNADGSIAVEGTASLALSVDKRFVSNGEYFEVAATMDPAVNSNAATLTFKYNPDKFVFHKFDAADGLTVISANNDAAKGEVTVTLGNMDGYGFTGMGTALFQAREDVQLTNEKLPINGSISYVLLENGDKYIRGAAGTAKIGTRGLLGDTNNDGVVDLIDLSNMIDWFGLAEDDALWDQIEYFDFNENGKIEISDIAKVASLIE